MPTDNDPLLGEQLFDKLATLTVAFWPNSS
jgi:hypothetical protein